jgi:hypothetical protein
MVAPKREAPSIAWILGALAIIGPVMLLDWHWLLAGTTGTVITAVIALVEMRSICPICKSKSLETTPAQTV